MNTPNKLTTLRIILVLPFVALLALFIYYQKHDVILYSHWDNKLTFFFVAGIIFVVAMITDFIDGYLARKNNQVTNFGKLFDPLADKIITSSAMILLSVANIIPFWVTLLIVLRDIIVDGSRNLAAKNNVQIAASFWGKAKTMIQSIGIALLFFIYPTYDFGHCDIAFEHSWALALLELPISVSMILSLISGCQYFKNIIPFINVK